MDKSVFCVLAFKEQKRKKVCILFASSRKCKNILKIIRESPGKAGEFIGIVKIIKIIIYKFIWIKKIKEKIQKSVDKTRVILYNKPIKKRKKRKVNPNVQLIGMHHPNLSKGGTDRQTHNARFVTMKIPFVHDGKIFGKL